MRSFVPKKVAYGRGIKFKIAKLLIFNFLYCLTFAQDADWLKFKPIRNQIFDKPYCRVFYADQFDISLNVNKVTENYLLTNYY